jgi:histidine phosphotransferase ChpT
LPPADTITKDSALTMTELPVAAAPDAVELASLLCSRLCHDLLSPVGALSNGLELLADESDRAMRQRCFELLEQSAQASRAKLQFFRLAFGGGDGEPIPSVEARAAVEGLAGPGGRIALTWAVGDPTLPRAAAKALLNLALIGIEALARGGTLEIGVETVEGASEIVVRAAGSRIAFDPAIGQALDGALPAGELSSRTAPATLLHLLASRAGGGLQYALDEDALLLGAMLPAT